MKEIKVGEYVRTRGGGIYKITNIIPYYENDKLDYDEQIVEFDQQFSNWKIWQVISFIVKHSFDIKDLVQAGDIILYNVNSKMTDIEIVKEHIDARTQEKTLRVGLWSLEQVKIKEILTKEQFDSRKYIVGDESNVCN